MKLSYRGMFPKRHTFFVVVHVEDIRQAVRNTEVALDGGADGIFLINHSSPAAHLNLCFEGVRGEFPDAWIGMNWLDLGAPVALSTMTPSINGLWLDNLGVVEHEIAGVNVREAQQFAIMRREWERAWGHSFLLFGGVAFKHQQSVQDVASVARAAVPFTDVITTSGKGTGIAPDIHKLRRMKEVIGDHPLANASGATPENVVDMMPYVDCFLVATGISHSHTELDPDKVRAFARALHA